MPVPTYDQFIEPILRFLAAHPESATSVESQITVAIRTTLSILSPDDRPEQALAELHEVAASYLHGSLLRAPLQINHINFLHI